MVETSSPDSTDPIDGDDPSELRREILRLRDSAIGERARAEVLADRVSTLETELHALDDHARALQRIIDRSPLRWARRVAGRVRRAVAKS